MTDIDPQAVTFVRNAHPNSSKYFQTAQDRLRVQSGEARALTRFRIAIPENRELVSASLQARAEDPFTGTINARAISPTGNYQRLTWNTIPANVAGSADRAGVVTGKAIAADVTADVASALAAGLERVAFKLTAGSATVQWLKTPSVTLVLTTRPVSVDPTDLSPAGVVGTIKPVFSWTAPVGVTQVRLQVSTVADFSSTVYNSTITSTVPQVDTSTGPAWAGLSGTRYVRAQHLTAAGWSAWETVTVTYLAPTNFVVSNPTGSDADPTPPSVWTPDAQAVEIISFLDGKRISTTGMVSGPIGALTPDEGATKAGQVLKRVHRFYDGQVRDDVEYVERVTETTFTPTATVAGLSTLVVTQSPGLPAVDVSWTRGTTPDEVALYHGDTEYDVVPGTAPWRDWTVQPNTDLVYGARAVVNSKRSQTLLTANLRTRVGAIWLVDPETGTGFKLLGTEGLEIAYGGEVVVHTPIDGAVLLRRTLTRRGPEGSITGLLDARGLLGAPWAPSDQLNAVEEMASQPERVFRLIVGDLNVPVVCSSLQAIFDGRTTVDLVWHRVSFTFSHAGGL